MRSWFAGTSASPQQRDTVILTANSSDAISPPFSGILKVDSSLHLSNPDLRHRLEEGLTRRGLSAIQKLENVAKYPSPFIFARLAAASYEDQRTNETDDEYQNRLDLPGGWKLLTTAANTGRRNGYFGVAFWHPENHQVMISHRGTVPTTLGALWADLAGVLFRNSVPQMESAVTFVFHVATALMNVSKTHDVHFELFFTGHSLGGWLAQITTFSIEYLHQIEDHFLKKKISRGYYHCHTVVFESPGCKDMLLKFVDNFDLRYGQPSIDLAGLDITTYLAAPNRINTCNPHLGTIYRLFPDLTKVERHWWKLNLGYNLTAHKMETILQCFDSATGHLLKDSFDRPMLHEVLDWPVSGIITGGYEYKRFFDWANHLNGYQPNPTEESYQAQTTSGYANLRYQTKKADMAACNINVFTTRERAFLEDYGKLRANPTLFQPEDIFELEDTISSQPLQIQLLRTSKLNAAEKKVRCNTDEELQTFIPYVKLLLTVCPTIAGRLTELSTPLGFAHQVLKIETTNLMTQLKKYPLDFKNPCENLRNFLRNKMQKIWCLAFADSSRMGIARLYNSFEKLNHCICARKTHITVLNMKSLLGFHNLADALSVIRNIQHHLFVVECEILEDYNQANKLLNSIICLAAGNRNVKVILIRQQQSKEEKDWVEDALDHARIVANVCRKTTHDLLRWEDLTSDSQQALFNTIIVNFPGEEPMHLCELTDDWSFIPPELLLSVLWPPPWPLTIGHAVPISKGYDPNLYVERALCRQVVVKQDFVDSKPEERFGDLIAKSQEEFLSLPKSERNVHWIAHEGGRLIWKQSRGRDLQNIRPYIDTHADLLSPSKFLQHIKPQRIVIIADACGTGKSTVLTHLSTQLKQDNPRFWVVRIDLNDHCHSLKEQGDNHFTTEAAVQFIMRLAKLENHVEMSLFTCALLASRLVNMKVVLFFDAFDEISPSYAKTVIRLLKTLVVTDIHQIWVTTRDHLREPLEDALLSLAYTLEPFNKSQQIEFIIKLWKQGIALQNQPLDDERMIGYAEQVVMKMAFSVSDYGVDSFSGIPMHTKLLAGYCQPCVTETGELSFNLPKELDLYELYKHFINKKYCMVLEKAKLTSVNDASKAVQQTFLVSDSLRQAHQQMALQEIFGDGAIHLLFHEYQAKLSQEEICRIGLVQMNAGRKVVFLHRSFAEYIVADFFRETASEERLIFNKMKASLELADILVNPKYAVVRKFLNTMLAAYPSVNILHMYVIDFISTFKDALLFDKFVAVLPVAAKEANFAIINSILNWLRGKEILIIEKLILGTNSYGTILHWLIWRCHVSGGSKGAADIQAVLRAVKEFGGEGTLYKLLVTANTRGDIPLNSAVKDASIDVVYTLLTFLETMGSPVHDSVLLARDGNGRTTLHIALKANTIVVVRRLLVMVRTMKPSSVEQLLQSKDSYGRTPLHESVSSCTCEVVSEILKAAREHAGYKTLRNMLFNACDYHSALHIAAMMGKEDIAQELFTVAQCLGTYKSTKQGSDFLLSTNWNGSTPLHSAVNGGRKNMVVTLLAMSRAIGETTLQSLLVAKDNEGRTALHCAINIGKDSVIRELILIEPPLKEATYRAFLLASDGDGRNALHTACMCRDGGKTVKMLLDTIKKTRKKEVLRELILAKQLGGNCETALHQTVVGNIKLVRDLVEAAIWVGDGALNEMTNKSDNKGRNALHVALDQRHDNTNFIHLLLTIAGKAGAEVLRHHLVGETQQTITPAKLAERFGGRDLVIALLYETDDEEEFLCDITVKDVARPYVFSDLTKYESLVRRFVRERETTIRYPAKLGIQDCGDPSEELLTKYYLAHDEIRNLVLSKDDFGRTPLHICCMGGKEFAVTWLLTILESMVDIHTMQNVVLAVDMKGLTPIQRAVSERNIAAACHLLTVVRKLRLGGFETLLHGADNNNPAVLSYSPEQTYVYCYTDLLPVARDLGPDTLRSFVLTQDDAGETVLHNAMRLGDFKFIKRLMDTVLNVAGHDVLGTMLLKKDRGNQTALHTAAKWCGRAVVDDALTTAHKLGNNVLEQLLHSTDDANQNALHVAVTRYHNKCRGLVRSLITFTVNLGRESLQDLVLARDIFGQTPLHCARLNSQLWTVIYILLEASKTIKAPTLGEFLLTTDINGAVVMQNEGAQNAKLGSAATISYLLSDKIIIEAILRFENNSQTDGD